MRWDGGQVRPALTANASFIELKHPTTDATLVASMEMAEGHVPISVGGPRYELPVQKLPLRRHAGGDSRALKSK